MDKDRRKSARQSIGEQPTATLSLTIDGHLVRILDIRDISPLGIGLVVSGRVNNGSKAMVRYKCGESRIEISGSIVWNLIDGAGSYDSTIGIYFDEDKMPLNMEFFRAVIS